MGPWNFVKGRLYEAHGDDPLDPPGEPRRVRQPRRRRPTPSTTQEQEDVVSMILEGL